MLLGHTDCTFVVVGHFWPVGFLPKCLVGALRRAWPGVRTNGSGRPSRAQGTCHRLVAVEHGTTGVHVVVKGVASNVDMLVGGDQVGGVVSTQCETLLAKTHGQLDTWMLVPHALSGWGGGWIGRAKSRGAHGQPCPTPPADAENKG